MKNKTTVLREMLIHGKEIVTAPGVYDGISALLAKQAGFSALYASGGAIARSTGYPDIGLMTMTEVSAVLRHLVHVTDLPIIADADTGFGNAINVARTVREFEETGIAGFHLEDQTFPKRCGHLNDKTIISMEEMCHKIRVARQSLRDPDFVLIARTDAIAIEGFDAAIVRAKAYLKAGADMIFVEAPETEAQIEEIARQIPEPKLINMFVGGKTPLVATEKLQSLGYRLIIIPSDLQRASIKAMQKTLTEIKRVGHSAALVSEMVSFNEREQIVDTKRYLELDVMR